MFLVLYISNGPCQKKLLSMKFDVQKSTSLFTIKIPFETTKSNQVSRY